MGDEREFELEWVSVYTFQCRRMGSFNHGRVLFVGDAAHQVSPFGARGANSGLQDADNLGWKLKLVIDGKAPEKLLDSYSEERVVAADENLMNSTRSTDFITPKSKVSRTFRNAVLGLAKDHAFGRALVNSGRLSVPAFLTTSSLNTPDDAADAFSGRMLPGAPMDDAPVLDQGKDGWLLDKVGQQFVALYFADDPAALDAATVAALSGLVNRRHCRAAAGDFAQGRHRRRRHADSRRFARNRRPALRRQARHGLSAASRPACRRPLAQARCGEGQSRGGSRHLQRLNGDLIMALNLNPNFSEAGKRYFSAYSPGDDFYEMLINTHRDLSDEQSELLNARLVLLLANHIGDLDTLREALKLAREGV